VGLGAPGPRGAQVYDAFREAGGNFVDTANVYTNGTSEKFLGEFDERPPRRGRASPRVHHASLDPNNRRRDPNAGGNGRKNMVQASRRR
jgi:hypothetical protein